MVVYPQGACRTCGERCWQLPALAGDGEDQTFSCLNCGATPA